MKKRFRITIDGKVLDVEVELESREELLSQFRNILEAVKEAVAAGATKSRVSYGKNVITSPVPGRVAELKVKEGSEVRQGQTVVVIESMKSFIEIRSPRNGKVRKVYVKQGDSVKVGQPLLEFEQ